MTASAAAAAAGPLLTVAIFSILNKLGCQWKGWSDAVPDSELKSLLSEREAGTPEGRIVRIMSERGTTSAADIARATGLARSTISMALAELRRARVIVEVSAPDSTRRVGRPTVALALNPEVGTCIGLQLGLREIRLLVADVSHSVICRDTIALKLDYSPEVAVREARRAIRDAYRRYSLSPQSVLGVGIAVSGPVAPNGRVQRASMVPTWAGVDIRAAFEPVLERAIFADNESNCAALAEMTWGAAAGKADFVFLKIDIGLGGAVVSHGRVVTGIAGAGGEFGHMSIDPKGELCRCGNRGCLELKAGFNTALELASRLHARTLTIDEMIGLARAGDTRCKRSITDIAAMAGRGLSIIGAILNPGLVVVGGRGALAGPLLIEPLTAAYERHALIKRDDVPEPQRMRIVTSQFPEDGSLMGAVALVLRQHGRLAQG
jgi:predicted NBD/HSP70 family sugar kinase